MSDIFLSYASADRDKAQSLASVLSEKGWSVWWDRTIPPGKTFDQVIEEALDSARCVVVLWSRAAVSSDWVKTEAAEAAARGILIPALIEDVKIPLEFRRIQAADLSEWDAPSAHPELEKVLDSITGLISQPEMPAPPEPETAEKDKEGGDVGVCEVRAEEHPHERPERRVQAPEPSEGPPPPRGHKRSVGLVANYILLVIPVLVIWALFFLLPPSLDRRFHVALLLFGFGLISGVPLAVLSRARRFAVGIITGVVIVAGYAFSAFCVILPHEDLGLTSPVAAWQFLFGVGVLPLAFLGLSGRRVSDLSQTHMRALSLVQVSAIWLVLLFLAFNGYISSAIVDFAFRYLPLFAVAAGIWLTVGSLARAFPKGIDLGLLTVAGYGFSWMCLNTFPLAGTVFEAVGPLLFGIAVVPFGLVALMALRRSA